MLGRNLECRMEFLLMEKDLFGITAVFLMGLSMKLLMLIQVNFHLLFSEANHVFNITFCFFSLVVSQ